MQKRIVKVKDLIEARNKIQIANRKKRRSQVLFNKVFPIFIFAVSNKKEFLDKELELFGYFQYLVGTLHPSLKTLKLGGRGRRKVLSKMRDAIELYYNIKEFGLNRPLDMVKDGNRYELRRGNRRLEIIYQLGYDLVGVREFESWLDYSRFLINESKKDNSISDGQRPG